MRAHEQAAILAVALALSACGHGAVDEDAGVAFDLSAGIDASVNTPVDAAKAGDLADVDLGELPPVPASYFGLQSTPTGPFPTLAFGTYRIWDKTVAWAGINTGSGTYDWTLLDTMLANAKSAGIDDGVVYTFGVTPAWASPHPTDTHCDFNVSGGCWLPSDLASDGTGTNATYIAFVRATAQHVNDPSYLATHAHVRYWEPWNEWYRNPLLGTTFAGCATGGMCSVHATYAQMVRMAEDVRCVIAGTVGSAPCASTPIDANARVLTPSSEPADAFGVQVMENFLHCDVANQFAGSACTTADRGRAAVDVIDFHFYTMATERADELESEAVRVRGDVRASDLAALPLWSGEGGWGLNTALTDVDLQAAFVAQFLLLGASEKLATNIWYEYDNTGWGTLYKSSALDASGIAYAQVRSWMQGRSLVVPCTTTGTRRACDFSGPGGYAAQALWDPAQTCSGGSCSTVSVSVAAEWLHYLDVTGASHAVTSGKVPVGAKPIWLQNR